MAGGLLKKETMDIPYIAEELANEIVGHPSEDVGDPDRLAEIIEDKLNELLR